MGWELWNQVLDRALAATFVILAVLLVRALMRSFSKKYVYALWLIVGIRLLCPVTLSSPLSLFNLNFGTESYLPVESHQEKKDADIPSQQESAGVPGNEFSEKIAADEAAVDFMPIEGKSGESREGDISMKTDGSTESDAFAERSGSAETGSRKQKTGIGMTDWLAAVWLSGMGILILWNALLTVRMRKRLTSAVLYRDNIYESDAIPSPLVMGVLHPRIYIPFRLTEKERVYILKHEQYHAHRKDHVVKLIAFFITVVYWFHPLVWVSWFCMVRDMEMSCDEHVLLEMGADIRQDYSRSLLAFATNRRQYTAGTLAFGETNVNKRVRHIMKFRKKGKWMSVLAVVLFALLGTACLTDGTEEKKADGSKQEPTQAEGTAQAERTAQPEVTPAGEVSREEFLHQSIRDMMPQEVSDVLDKVKCRTVKDGKKEVTYLFGNGEKGEDDTLRLDFTYNGDKLTQYVSKEYGYLMLLSINIGEVWRNPDSTRKDWEKRGRELVRQFDKVLLNRTGSRDDLYKICNRPERYGDDESYMLLKNTWNGDTYVVCLAYDMVVQYDAATKDAGGNDLQIAYKGFDENGKRMAEWSYYKPDKSERKLLESLLVNPMSQRDEPGYENTKKQWKKECKKHKDRGFALYYQGEHWVAYDGGYLRGEKGDILYSPKLTSWLVINMFKKYVFFEPDVDAVSAHMEDASDDIKEDATLNQQKSKSIDKIDYSSTDLYSEDEEVLTEYE